MNNTQEMIGKILDSLLEKDAIHIAVAPVIAGMLLHPGQHIGFDSQSLMRVALGGIKAIGIVDPFLKQTVRIGQTFWMFLYPNTITSLRHNWTHPAFEKQELNNLTSSQEERIKFSRDWLENWGNSVGISYAEVLEAAEGDHIFDSSNIDVPEGLYDHYEIATGKKISERDRLAYFSCSC